MVGEVLDEGVVIQLVSHSRLLANRPDRAIVLFS